MAGSLPTPKSLEIEVARTDPSLIENPQYLWVDSEQARLPSQLKHLSLIDVGTMDPIFRHLPADLDSLSIIDTRSRKYGTNFEVPGYDDDYRTWLTHTEIASIVAGNSQSFAGLTYLRTTISTGRQSSHWYYTGEGDRRFYYAEIPLDVLRILAASCPLLGRLDLHFQRQRFLLPSPEDFAEALSPIRHTLATFCNTEDGDGEVTWSDLGDAIQAARRTLKTVQRISCKLSLSRRRALAKGSLFYANFGHATIFLYKRRGPASTKHNVDGARRLLDNDGVKLENKYLSCYFKVHGELGAGFEVRDAENRVKRSYTVSHGVHGGGHLFTDSPSILLIESNPFDKAPRNLLQEGSTKTRMKCEHWQMIVEDQPQILEKIWVQLGKDVEPINAHFSVPGFLTLATKQLALERHDWLLDIFKTALNNEVWKATKDAARYNAIKRVDAAKKRKVDAGPEYAIVDRNKKRRGGERGPQMDS
ncbi:hypothetical protein B0H14DRAFT_2591429 [Mycena olivaceomarginata]|nr:hypothetical protein B0H14DRAFT_2591429 [Mycena olivaceomarginata]